MKARTRQILHAGVAVMAALAVFFAIRAARYLVDNRIPNVCSEVELFVRPETTPQQVIDSLCANAVVKHPQSLQRVFADKQVADYIKPGHYVVQDGSTSAYVARMLNNGWQTPVKLALSGTLRRKGEIARKISNQIMADSAAVRAAFDNQQLLGELGFDTVTVFALFIPDTYEVYWTDTPEEVFHMFKKAYDRFWTANRRDKAAAQGLTPLQVSIVASIVSGETNYVPEMPKIASVYLNRYHKGMKLQADPTIAYCFDYNVNRILRKHLQVDSPYNTYKYAGLPPGPIYIPSRNALEAVLNPASDKYLFFCADPSFNGSHRFAVTYSEHLSNARAFQKALNKRIAECKAAQQ